MKFHFMWFFSRFFDKSNWFPKRHFDIVLYTVELFIEHLSVLPRRDIVYNSKHSFAVCSDVSNGHLHLSLSRGGCWGITDDFTTSFLHFPLFPTALLDLTNARPVHSLVSSSHFIFRLPALSSSPVHCALQDGFSQRVDAVLLQARTAHDGLPRKGLEWGCSSVDRASDRHGADSGSIFRGGRRFDSCLVFSPLSLCLLPDGFHQTWWMGDRSIPLKFASLYHGHEVFV